MSVSEVTTIRDRNAERAKSVEELLTFCMAQKYDRVVVFGFDIDGNVEIRHSTLTGITALVGALERAKFELIRDDRL